MISIRSRAVSWILTLTLVFTTMFGSTGMAFADTDVGGSTNVVKVGTDKEYTTLDDALETKAKEMTGDVTIEIYDKVTLTKSLAGSYDSIKFVAKDSDAEIYLDVQGYITATGKKVAFEDLKLSKSTGGFITNAGFMNVAFGVYDVKEVAYTDCTFLNGAYASSGKVTFTGCTFYRSHDKYGLWAYGNVDTTVDGCTFNDYRGIKMYAEGAAKTVDLTVKSTDFTKVTDKPAIVLTYGESVTLEENKYSSTGVFELDKDGAPNGTSVTSDVAPTCVNDDGVCGVLVDGKIYTTVAQAADIVTEDSTVTLLHDSNETVEFGVGVTLNKNGYTASGVTVKAPTAKIGNKGYTSLQAAIDAAEEENSENITIELFANATLDITAWDTLAIGGEGTKTITINGNGKTLTFNKKNSDWNHVATNNDAKLILNNMTITDSGYNNGPWNRYDINFGCDVELNKVTSEKALAFKADATLNTVTVNDEKDVYAIWVQANGQTVEIDGLTVDAGRGIKIDEEYVTAKEVTLSVANATFTTAKKAAIMVKSAEGADITLENVNIDNVAADNANAVWVDEDSAGTFGKVNVIGGSVAQEGIGSFIAVITKDGRVISYHKTLQAAIDAVKDGDVITLGADIEENVTVPQKENVKFTIDGNNKAFYGTITVDGKSAAYETAGLTIKNIKFYATSITKDACINLGGTNSTRYISNLTVENCKFAGGKNAKVGIKSYTGGDKNLKVINCTAENMHSLLQIKNSDGIQVEGCTITDSKNGISVGASADTVIKDVTIDTEGYGIRADGHAAGDMTVENANIAAAKPVIVRDTTSAYALVVKGGKLEPTTEGDYAVIVTNGDDEDPLALPTGDFSMVVDDEDAAYPSALYVAKIGNKGYVSIEDAMTAAKVNDTVTILAGDYTENLNVNKDVTVIGETDADGNNLVNIKGKLNITADGATVKNINVNNGGNSAGYINAKDVLVEGCTVVGGNGFRSCYTTGTVTFKDSTITGSVYGIHFDGSAGGNIVIDNCTITGWTSFASSIKKVTMKDTSFEKGNYNYIRFYQDAEISGCTFNEDMAVDMAVAGTNLDITDSTVENGEVTDLVSEGDIVNCDITVDGEKLVRVAMINNTYYVTLQDAIEAATAEDTIVLVANVEGDESIVIDKAVTFELNKKTVTVEFVLANLDATITVGDDALKVVSAFKEHNVTFENSVYSLVKDHVFSEEWSIDEENHWYACDCGEVKDKAKHEMKWNFVNEINVTEIDFTNAEAVKAVAAHEYACEVCGWVDPEATKTHDFEVKIVKEPTKEDPNGEAKLFCKECGYEETKTFEEIAAITTYLVTEYYDEAYAYAYEYADENGYIDATIEGIDAVVAALDEALAVANESGMSDELKAELNAAYENIIPTAEQLKVLIKEADYLDEETYNEAVKLLAELETNLNDFCSIMEQAGLDAADQLWIAYEYVKPIVIEQLKLAVEAGTAWMMEMLGELYDAFIAALPEIDKALYDWFYNNPETVIGFFYEYGDELGYLFDKYGDDLACVLGYVLATYGPDAVEYALENPEEALAKWVEWYNKHGVRALAMIDKYIRTLDEMGAFDGIKASLKELAAEVEAYIIDYAEKVAAALEAKYNELSEAAQEALAELKAAIEALDVEAILAALEDLEAELQALYEDATSGNYIVTGDSYYVALGDSEAGYAQIVADEMKLDAEQFVNAGIPGITAAELADLLASGDEDLIAEIAKADFITVGFSNNTITAYAKDQVADLMAKNAEEVDWEAAVGPNGAAAVESALVELEAALIEEGLGEAAEMVVTAVEAYAYACISFATNYPEVIDTIKDINADAQVVIVGMYNPFENAVLDVEGTEVPVGEFVGALVDLANVHYVSYAMLTGNAVYVHAPAVETKAPFEKAMGIEEFVVALADLEALEPSEAGNTYIAEQIIDALNVVDKDVYNFLKAIEAIEGFGEVTRENLTDAKALAEAARAAWDAMSDAEKELAGLEKYKVLVDFELAIAEVELGIAEDIAAAEKALAEAQAKAAEVERALKITDSTVTNLKAKVQNKSQIKVTWEAAEITPDQYRVALIRDGKKVGTYWVAGDKETVTLKNLLRGTNFTVRVTPVAKVDGKKYFSIYKTSNKVKTQLQKANLTVKKAGLKKQIMSKDQNSTGFQIYISKDKKFKKGVTKFVYKTNKKGLNVKIKNKNFKKGVNYVKVRSYTKVNGKKVYGAWSGTVKVVK